MLILGVLVKEIRILSRYLGPESQSFIIYLILISFDQRSDQTRLRIIESSFLSSRTQTFKSLNCDLDKLPPHSILLENHPRVLLPHRPRHRGGLLQLPGPVGDHL